MKTRKISLIFVWLSFAILTIFGCASRPKESGGSEPRSSLLYVYSRLALKDLDEMNALVKGKIRESRSSEGDKVAPLREGLQAVYARPNSDFMIDKVVSPLRNELDEQAAWDSTVRSLVEEAVQALRNPGNVKPAAQVTYAVMLENFIAEMKPRVDEESVRQQLAFIRDAKIEFTEQARRERQLGMMGAVRSPSEVAGDVLKSYDEKMARENSKSGAGKKKK